MAKDRFLIAPIKNGMRSDEKPWQIPEDSFERLENAYIYDGVINKRFGSSYTGSGAAEGFESMRSRLRVPLKGAGVGITSDSGGGIGNASGTVPGGGYGKPGQMFSIGSAYYTVTATGAMTTCNSISSTHTYDINTGAYNFVGAVALTQVYFYPSEPVMGLYNFETGDIHERPAIAADARYIYKHNGITWDAVGPLTGGGAYDVFTGSNSDFFHMTNWMGSQFYNTYLFVTNFVSADGMWYWDETIWTAFAPKFLVAGTDVQNIVMTARIILPFKDRLLLLNTVENDAAGNTYSYQNRCRFSRNGTPTTAPGSTAWLEKDEVGYVGAGWIEAPTEEEIISAEYIRDRLIIFFERSTWELAFTGSNEQPFVWQKINTELGSESPRSSVPFDKVILSVGTTGINACNGANVARIDKEIPEEVFKIRNNNDGPFRVAGVRDYIKEMVYWAIPYMEDSAHSETFPNRVLVYNYKQGTWSINNDSITAFGYSEQKSGKVWEDDFEEWGSDTSTWLSEGCNPSPIQVIAGNQQGYVFEINTDKATNEAVMQISKVAVASPVTTLTIINHNLDDNEFIKIEHCQGSVEINSLIVKATVVDSDTITFNSGLLAISAYEGLGTVSRVSRVDILTKEFNPYIKHGSNVFVSEVAFAVGRTVNGKLDVDYFSSSSNINMKEESAISGTALGEFTLDCFPYVGLSTIENTQNLLWHSLYFQSSGSFIQIRLYYSDTIMLTNSIVEEGLEIEGMVLHTSPVGKV